jgi:hypothetical protein
MRHGTTCGRWLDCLAPRESRAPQVRDFLRCRRPETCVAIHSSLAGSRHPHTLHQRLPSVRVSISPPAFLLLLRYGMEVAVGTAAAAAAATAAAAAAPSADAAAAGAVDVAAAIATSATTSSVTTTAVAAATSATAGLGCVGGAASAGDTAHGPARGCSQHWSCVCQHDLGS